MGKLWAVIENEVIVARFFSPVVARTEGDIELLSIDPLRVSIQLQVVMSCRLFAFEFFSNASPILLFPNVILGSIQKRSSLVCQQNLWKTFLFEIL